MKRATRESTPELDKDGYVRNSHTVIRNTKYVCDTVHGQIPLEPIELQFIDTPQFQRLRDIKQLANCLLVYPGATHTRFEHSLGTSYLAREWVTKLQRNQRELMIDQRDIDCVAIAGLVHDLGHGPFSHLFDGPFMSKIQMPGHKKWTHEDASEMMFDYLIDENVIDFSRSDRNFVKALVRGKASNCGAEDAEKAYLFDIVANTRNSIDVDKFDYLLRDAMHVGFKTDFSYQRVMDSSMVIDQQICFQEKMAYNIYDLYHVRFKLHKLVYKHRVGRAVERMMVDAMVKANPVLKFSDAIYDPVKFQDLTDATVVNDIYRSKRPELEGARKLIQRIKRRDLYRVVDEIAVTDANRRQLSDITTEAIAAAGEGSWNLKPEDIHIDRVKTNYAMKDANPVDSVRFFSRWDATTSFTISKEQVSGLLPEKFEEEYMKIYSCDNDKTYYVQQAARKVLERNAPGIIKSCRSGLTIPSKETPSLRKGMPPSTPSFSRSNPSTNPNTAVKKPRTDGVMQNLFSITE
eukprot:CFRG4871T1